MSHWRNTMVDGAKYWIICKWLKLLRKSGRLQLIQNSAPPTIMRRQCDIRIDENENIYTLNFSDLYLEIIFDCDLLLEWS